MARIRHCLIHTFEMTHETAPPPEDAPHKMLQCHAVRCSVLQRVLQCAAVCRSVLQCVAVCSSMLQCVAVCCSVLQCVAVCCSVL